MKILVVDDSKAMRMIVQRNIRQAGFEAAVVEASDGQQGLEQVAASAPDLILSDWNMPVKSGFEFLCELRASGDKTTFGFVTSESTTEMREQAVAAGADFFLVKPFTAAQFQQVLGTLV
jgi:two-component system chemotaxis response regulator CheY